MAAPARKPRTDTANGATSASLRLQTLIDEGLVTAAEAASLVQRQREKGEPILTALERAGFAEGDRLAAIASRLTGMRFVDLHAEPPDPKAAELIPAAFAKRHCCAAIGFDGDALVVAVGDPSNVVVADDLRMMTNRDVKMVGAFPDQIRALLDRNGKGASALEQNGTKPTAAKVSTLERQVGVSQSPIVQEVDRIICKAVESRASDIHIEPEEGEMRVRYRIDGVLHEIQRISKEHQNPLVSRLKVMADINIAERRLPQDGRISLEVGDKPIDLRVATLPGVWGEEVVIRILDRNSSLLPLTSLGVSPEQLTRYEASVRKTYGAILVTGPTGSGKSTTLYSTLSLINDPTKKIITVEDPVEYRLPGLRQLQVNPQIGLTFASCLRSILRADPDVVMVGEIRDSETATIAVHAAMTGHLVLSTLHTNDSSTAPTRLIEMNVEPFLVASAIECVVAQRLARVLCPRCAEPAQPNQAMLQQLGIRFDQLPGRMQMRKPKGCAHCAQTGYRGRTTLTEILLVDEEIERAIVERRSSDDIHRLAVANGMQTLLEDGIDKVRAGVTTLEEVLRVIG